VAKRYSRWGIQFTRTYDATAFVALGSGKSASSVIDNQDHTVSKRYLFWSGQRVWQMAFTPDEKYTC